MVKNFYIPFQNCKYYVSILYTFELLDVEHGSPISHKYVKVNYLDLELAIDPLPQGEFCTL